MVHALREAWRVLKPSGSTIDLRPISVDVPLLIRTTAGWKPAGKPDQSPDRVHDMAADHAFRSLLQDHLFIQVERKYFHVNNYWDSLKGLKEDIEECWKDDVIVSAKIWKQARVLFKKGSGKGRICIPFRKKISLYRKI